MEVKIVKFNVHHIKSIISNDSFCCRANRKRKTLKALGLRSAKNERKSNNIRYHRNRGGGLMEWNGPVYCTLKSVSNRIRYWTGWHTYTPTPHKSTNTHTRPHTALETQTHEKRHHHKRLGFYMQQKHRKPKKENTRIPFVWMPVRSSPSSSVKISRNLCVIYWILKLIMSFYKWLAFAYIVLLCMNVS